jgi:hypothetical protein
MTYEELRKVPICKPVYEEIKAVNKVYKLTYDGIDFVDDPTNIKHFLMLCECDEEECLDYNWNYRVWNEMPTEEEQKTPWKDDPYV